ncbi:adenylyl-sulfate kinase [Evansella cellulosilytica]|uniref:Adenylyl-sulfate kinase n=1 Tax=Evansella cellulosilytica (strain ATCC 21833 / DSM 2522 / FERM P-1141 / JCM 9156 / N-4) TaxID=649639 RepID=E6U1U7_EVAC2|nr:adenylyl-sulfate kinase [Evansella cellulosilytica]ADU31594.1 adenylylsulfate kinase [Evansella cellulosilytica DSM 2522]
MSQQEKVENIHWHNTTVSKEDRQSLNNHKGSVVWFTGLSGSGKSTLANAVEKKLHDQGIRTYVLDGDNIRHGLNKGLGFQPDDRKENIRRIGEVSKLFVDAGIVVLTAFISPYREDRQLVRSLLESGEFHEVYTKCALDECERRDPKGLYKKARDGEIPAFTGISAPYEEPENAEVVIETDKELIDDSVNKVVAHLKELKVI